MGDYAYIRCKTENIYNKILERNETKRFVYQQKKDIIIKKSDRISDDSILGTKNQHLNDALTSIKKEKFTLNSSGESSETTISYKSEDHQLHSENNSFQSASEVIDKD